MMSIIYIFWMYVILFAIIGAMRGWAKEVLVSFSVIVALALLTLMERYVPMINVLVPENPQAAVAEETLKSLFAIRIIVLLVLVFFGYQTVYIPRFAERGARVRLQDTLLGIFIGLLNGYLIAGSVFFFLNEARFSFDFFILPSSLPANIGEPIQSGIDKLLPLLPPRLLGVPGIYFAVIIAFIFVIVVFV